MNWSTCVEFGCDLNSNVLFLILRSRGLNMVVEAAPGCWDRGPGEESMVTGRVSESVAIWPSDGEAQNILRGTILVK